MRVAALALALLIAAASVPSAQPSLAANVGSSCSRGQYALSGFLLVCGSNRRFRYALPEDIPPAPPEGYLHRPSWYPPLGEQVNANNPPRCPLSGRVTFTSPVISEQDLDVIVPQGELIGDHVTPIDHGYIGVAPLRIPDDQRATAGYVPIMAPADAEVVDLSTLGSPTSLSILLAHGCETYTQLLVVNRLAGALASLQNDLLARGRLSPHLRVLAGTIIGEQRDNPLDFAVRDGAAWLPGYVSPFSYAEGEAWKPFTVNPWPYFSPDLEELYQSRMQRLEAPRWGRIDLDVGGSAAGNWFLAGTVGYSGRSIDDFRTTQQLPGGTVPGKNTPAWSHLAIVPHAVQPRRWMFSVGWWQNERGDPVQFLIDRAANQPSPAELTPASGVVVYTLRNWDFSTRSPAGSFAPRPIGYDLIPLFIKGLVAVQVNEDQSLTMEIVPSLGGEMPPFSGFTSARRTYRR